MTKENKPTFKVVVKGVDNFDEQCRLQCTLIDTLNTLGYTINSENFELICE